MRKILQVPMSASLKSNATNVAKEMGFSSLQEVVRVLLNKLATGRLSIEVEENIIPLSAKNEKRYMAMDEDFRKKKNIYTAKDVGGLMKKLHED